MRQLWFALLFVGLLSAQEQITPAWDSTRHGSFYVEGIVYEYAATADYTVVAAAHSVINHKFVAVKVRIYNTAQHSVTVKPEDVLVEDAVAGHAVATTSGTEIANRMRKPYNMARMGVTGNTGSDPTETAITSDMVSPQFRQMMQAMAARANGPMAGGRNVLYTDTPGALDTNGAAPLVNDCDLICRLRNREASSIDELAQLQHQNTPDYVEQCSLRANTIPPRANMGGVLYIPLGKLSEQPASVNHGKKARAVRVTVPVDGQSFQFVVPVE